jgi:tetratricopeptide (TPR) repeat protein
MFTGRIGATRTMTDPAAVAEIVDRCARLPLALAITAARVALHPELPLAALAAELRDTETGLDPFRGDDTATDVRAVFSWSYGALSTPAAMLFRTLGSNPGPDVSADAAASLVGRQLRAVRPHLGELTRGSLLAEHIPGRYRFHDLLCAYAEEQTRRVDPDEERRSARRRIVDHYLHTAFAAAMLLTPRRHPIALDPVPADVTVSVPRDSDAAMAWFAAEHANLLAVVDLDDPDLDDRLWPLAWTLTTYLERRGYLRENLAVQSAALRAANRSGDVLGRAYAYRNLGTTRTRLGSPEAGHADFLRARTLFEAAGDDIMAAHTSLGLAWAIEQQGSPDQAIVHIERAMLAYRAADHPVGLANALNALGHCRNELGDYTDGLAPCVEALGIFRQIGDRTGEAGTLDSLGYVHFRLGDSARGIAAYHAAIDIYRDLGDRYNEADAYANLGDGHALAGDAAVAGEAWRTALEMLTQLDHPAAADLRAKLAAAM